MELIATIVSGLILIIVGNFMDDLFLKGAGIFFIGISIIVSTIEGLKK